jgi:hypothetical protein
LSARVCAVAFDLLALTRLTSQTSSRVAIIHAVVHAGAFCSTLRLEFLVLVGAILPVNVSSIVLDSREPCSLQSV